MIGQVSDIFRKGMSLLNMVEQQRTMIIIDSQALHVDTASVHEYKWAIIMLNYK